MAANKHLPSWLKSFFNESWCVEETSWNAYPLCKTEYTVPMLGKVKVSIDSMHLSGKSGDENALKLIPEQLRLRKVEVLDIGNDGEAPPAGLDPRKFSSSKTGLGPLMGDWQETCPQLMMCYKVVTVQCELPFGLHSQPRPHRPAPCIATTLPQATLHQTPLSRCKVQSKRASEQFVACHCCHASFLRQAAAAVHICAQRLQNNALLCKCSAHCSSVSIPLQTPLHLVHF